ncbi:MAG TPA: urease accessory protein UreD, partial [Quisquiliibacterium sp.]|nr:urease accessory protein UreD [Quisquiliibacterium sp.]
MGWNGHLHLDYRHDGGRTIGRDRHDGPLRVLRSLYPEGPGTCHHVLVHPPGGIVGGDTLQVNVDVQAGAHALITTPGATRFYRSAGALASQTVHARLAPGARLEWLPLETIAYRGTRAVNRMRFALEEGAQMIGWDMLALGLPAAGAPFDDGRYEQQIELPGSWLDRGILDAASPWFRTLLESPLGWDGQTALATMWCACGTGWPSSQRDALLDDARELLGLGAAAARSGATSPAPGLVLVRALGARVEPLWETLQAVRHAWRTRLWGTEPAAPR